MNREENLEDFSSEEKDMDKNKNENKNEKNKKKKKKGQKKNENENYLGKMTEDKENDERVKYADFMEKGWYKGVTMKAERNKHGEYYYIDVWVDVGVEVPEEANYDTVKMKFGLPEPKKLREDGELPPGNLLSDFVKEIGEWETEGDLTLDDLRGHKIKFPVISKDTENGKRMDIVRKQDGNLSIECVE